MTDFRVTADEADIPLILRLAEEGHEDSRFRYIPFHVGKAEKIIRRVFADKTRSTFMLALRRGEPVGFVHVSVSEYHIGSDYLIASIHSLFVSKTVRSGLSGGKVAVGLLNGAKSWAKARNASEILLHVTSGVQLKATHSLAKRMGFDVIGGSYVLKY